jgi:hypothetical protein
MNVSLPVRLKFRHLHIRLYRVLRAENLGVPMYSNVESSNQTMACSFDIIRVLANSPPMLCMPFLSSGYNHALWYSYLQVLFPKQLVSRAH